MFNIMCLTLGAKVCVCTQLDGRSIQLHVLSWDKVCYPHSPLLTSDLHSCVACASPGSHTSVEVVLDHDHFLAAIWVGLQDSLDGGVGSLSATSSDVPSTRNNRVSHESLIVKLLTRCESSARSSHHCQCLHSGPCSSPRTPQ